MNLRSVAILGILFFGLTIISSCTAPEEAHVLDGDWILTTTPSSEPAVDGTFSLSNISWTLDTSERYIGNTTINGQDFIIHMVYYPLEIEPPNIWFNLEDPLDDSNTLAFSGWYSSGSVTGTYYGVGTYGTYTGSFVLN
jgi:hypothetical protein